MEWIPTPLSTSVARYAYDPETRRLYVEFTSGAGGYYANVPPELVDEFSYAESKGTFIGRRLKDNPQFPWTRLHSAASTGQSPRSPRRRQ